jgi:hypothetical protein
MGANRNNLVVVAADEGTCFLRSMLRHFPNRVDGIEPVHSAPAFTNQDRHPPFFDAVINPASHPPL